MEDYFDGLTYDKGIMNIIMGKYTDFSEKHDADEDFYKHLEAKMDYVDFCEPVYENHKPICYQYIDHTENITNQVKDCSLTCHRMLNYLLECDYPERKKQLKLLQDCANICDTQSLFLVKNSQFSKQLALLCAHICEICGNECKKWPDYYSQHCAKICLDCAIACIQYGKM